MGESAPRPVASGLVSPRSRPRRQSTLSTRHRSRSARPLRRRERYPVASTYHHHSDLARPSGGHLTRVVGNDVHRRSLQYYVPLRAEDHRGDGRRPGQPGGRDSFDEYGSITLAGTRRGTMPGLDTMGDPRSRPIPHRSARISLAARSALRRGQRRSPPTAPRRVGRAQMRRTSSTMVHSPTAARRRRPSQRKSATCRGAAGRRRPQARAQGGTSATCLEGFDEAPAYLGDGLSGSCRAPRSRALADAACSAPNFLARRQSDGRPAGHRSDHSAHGEDGRRPPLDPSFVDGERQVSADTQQPSPRPPRP